MVGHGHTTRAPPRRGRGLRHQSRCKAAGASLGSISDLSPRPSPPLSRRQREERAYRLAMVGGAAAVGAVIGVVLAALGVVSVGVPLLGIVVAAICGLIFRRTVSGR